MNVIQKHDQIKKYTAALIEILQSRFEGYEIPIYWKTGDNRNMRRLKKEIPQKLPAFVLSLNDFQRSIERQLQPMAQQESVKIDDFRVMFSYAENPYDILYDLEVHAKDQTTLFQITEHISSLFTDGRVYVHVSDHSCPILLESSSVELDIPESLYETGVRSAIFSFNVKGLIKSYIDTLSVEHLIDRKKEAENKGDDDLVKEIECELAKKGSSLIKEIVLKCFVGDDKVEIHDL